MSDLTNKDAEQDSKLAVLETKIQTLGENIEAVLERMNQRVELVHERIDKTDNKIKELDNELRGRIRKNEKWIAGAGAVIAAATTILGIITAAESMEVNYGSNGAAQQEVMLQLQGSRNK